MQKSEGHFERLARAGYWAKGIVYILLGGLSLSSVISGGQGEDTPEDALSSLLSAPMGRIILGLIALGLAGYVLWRLAQSVLNADDHDNDTMGIVTRLGQFFSAVANSFLVMTAAGLAIQGGGSDGGSDQTSIIAMVMAQPFGPWLVGIVGLIFVGAGLGQIYRGVVKDYEGRIVIPADKKAVLDPVSQFGLIARGALFVVIGGLIVYAGITVSPEDTGGLRDALDWLRSQPYGAVFYGMAAAGLAAYGGYSIVQALYRRMDAPDAEDVKQMIPNGR